MVVIFGRPGEGGQHDTAKALRLDPLGIGDRLIDRGHGGLTYPEEPPFPVAAEILQPAVIGLEHGVHVIAVGVVTEHHAESRIDYLCGDPVAILIEQPRLGIPAAAMKIVEGPRRIGQLFGREARRRRQGDRDLSRQSVDQVDAATILVHPELRCLVAPFRLEIIAVAARRFGNVRVGRNRLYGGDALHGTLLIIVKIVVQFIYQTSR